MDKQEEEDLAGGFRNKNITVSYVFSHSFISLPNTSSSYISSPNPPDQTLRRLHPATSGNWMYLLHHPHTCQIQLCEQVFQLFVKGGKREQPNRMGGDARCHHRWNMMLRWVWSAAERTPLSSHLQVFCSGRPALV